MIATGYQLPFRFTCPVAGGVQDRPLALRIATRQPDAGGDVAAAVELFAALAAAGACGGAVLAPWDTAFQLTSRPAPDERHAEWGADPCRIAAQAWVILCHLLLRVHQIVPIDTVDVQVADGSPHAALGTDPQGESTYPGAFPHLPFDLVDNEPEGGTYSFHIDMAAPLDAAHGATLDTWLDAWVATVRAGGYGLAPVDVARDYVEPLMEGVDAYDTTVEWAVCKLRADPVAAIDGLLNLLGCFHVRHQPFIAVEIE